MNQNASEYIENGIQIQEVDARELEVQLVRTAALMDRHQPSTFFNIPTSRDLNSLNIIYHTL